MKTAFASIFAGLLLFVGLIWLANSNNVQAPAGYATYVIERPILGTTVFKGVILGPNSTGRNWRYYGDSVSVTPYSYSEEFKGSESIIAKDKLAMIGDGHIVWRIRGDNENIRTYMEKFGGLDDAHSTDETARLSYSNYIQQPFKTLIREEFATQNGLDIPNNVAAMSENITKKLQERLAATPFEILQVVIGNAQPPAVVLDQIAAKVAKTQELARKVTEQSIADANKAIEQANGEAEGERAVALAKQRKLANQALSDSITPQLIQYLAIENMKGAERIYVPTGSNGIPLVGTLPFGAVSKPATP
jgi:regulator of protease activity HflC (stomatin/prohibitin superfamily)